MLDQLSALLANIWTEVGHKFAGQPQAHQDEARTVIAKALLYHAGNGHTDPAVLKERALQALVQAYPQLPLP